VRFRLKFFNFSTPTVPKSGALFELDVPSFATNLCRKVHEQVVKLNLTQGPRPILVIREAHSLGEVRELLKYGRKLNPEGANTRQLPGDHGRITTEAT
jgi:hypothetical protein